MCAERSCCALPAATKVDGAGATTTGTTSSGGAGGAGGGGATGGGGHKGTGGSAGWEYVASAANASISNQPVGSLDVTAAFPAQPGDLVVGACGWVHVAGSSAAASTDITNTQGDWICMMLAFAP